MKNELCLLTWVYALQQLIILSEPTVALRVYHNNAYEVSDIDRRIVIPKPEHSLKKLNHTALKRQQITLIEQIPRRRQRVAGVRRHHITHKEFSPVISSAKHGPPLVHQRHHIGLRRQEIIHALNEDTEKTDSEDDIESLGRRIDESGNEIKDGTSKPDTAASAILSDKHTAAATKYIISKIKEIQEKLFKRTGSKALEEKLAQMAPSPVVDVNKNQSSTSNATTTPLAEVKKNITSPTPAPVENKQVNKTATEDVSKSAEVSKTTDVSKSADASKSADVPKSADVSKSKDESSKPLGDGSKVPDRRKIIPEEVVDKILEKFQQLKQEAKHIVSESRHSVEHADTEGGKDWTNVDRSRAKRNHIKPRKAIKRDKTSRIAKKGRVLLHIEVGQKRKINGKYGKIKNKHRLVSNDTNAAKRTLTVLENGRALLNYKSGVVTDADAPPPIGSQVDGEGGEDFTSLQGFGANPYAQFSTEAGVALPNLPPTFVVYDKPGNKLEGLDRAETRSNDNSRSRSFLEDLLENVGPWKCSMQDDCQHLRDREEESDSALARTNIMNYGLSQTMGISPQPINSQMSYYGNEEKNLLNMASGTATADIPPDQSPMGDIQSLISRMEAGRFRSTNEQQPSRTSFINGEGHYTPPSELSFETGIAYPGQKPILYKNTNLLKDIFEGRAVTLRNGVSRYHHKRNITNVIAKKISRRSIKGNTKISYTNKNSEMMSDLMNVENEAALYTKEVLHDVPPSGEWRSLPSGENPLVDNYNLLNYGLLEKPNRQLGEVNSQELALTNGIQPWLIGSPIINTFFGKKNSKLDIPSQVNNNLRTLAAIIDNQGKLYQSNKHSKEEVVAANVISNAIQGALVPPGPNNPYKYLDKVKYENILSGLQREIQRKNFSEMLNNAYNQIKGRR